MTLRDDEREMLRDVPDDDPRAILAVRLVNERARAALWQTEAERLVKDNSSLLDEVKEAERLQMEAGRARALLGCGSEEPLLDAVRRTSSQLTEQMADIAKLREELTKAEAARDEIGIQLAAAQAWIQGQHTIIERLRAMSQRLFAEAPCWCEDRHAKTHDPECTNAREAVRAAKEGA